MLSGSSGSNTNVTTTTSSASTTHRSWRRTCSLPWRKRTTSAAKRRQVRERHRDRDDGTGPAHSEHGLVGSVSADPDGGGQVGHHPESAQYRCTDSRKDEQRSPPLRRQPPVGKEHQGHGEEEGQRPGPPGVGDRRDQPPPHVGAVVSWDTCQRRDAGRGGGVADAAAEQQPADRVAWPERGDGPTRRAERQPDGRIGHHQQVVEGTPPQARGDTADHRGDDLGGTDREQCRGSDPGAGVGHAHHRRRIAPQRDRCECLLEREDSRADWAVAVLPLVVRPRDARSTAVGSSGPDPRRDASCALSVGRLRPRRS